MTILRAEFDEVVDGHGPAGAPRSGGPGNVSSIAQTFNADAQQRISLMELMSRVTATGIGTDDPRVREILDAHAGDGGGLSAEQFAAVCEANGGLIARALRGDLVIPDFSRMESELREIYDNVRPNSDGKVADYIPQLKRVDPDKFGIAVCTVDGQRFSIGDTSDRFCVQSMCKPINYSLALEEHGIATVHRHVGREPSGRGFNELSLTDIGLPHNPMINSGAIMTTSLLHPDDELADRFDHVADAWRRLSGSNGVGFNNSVYLSERKTADRNFALAHMLHSFGIVEDDPHDAVVTYVHQCAVEVTVVDLAVMAATLASGGIQPVTGELPSNHTASPGYDCTVSLRLNPT